MLTAMIISFEAQGICESLVLSTTLSAGSRNLVFVWHYTFSRNKINEI